MKRLILLTIVLALQATGAASQTQSRPHTYFSDVVLLNQDGQPMRFYSDVIKGKTVVIESFFSTCSGTCPVMNATFGKIQAAIGDRLGQDVILVSITVDSENDTPERLKAYAKRVAARPGWLFLTGSKENVNQALHKLGLAVGSREQHKNLFIVGNEPKGLWKKVFGLARPEEIIPIVEGVINDK